MCVRENVADVDSRIKESGDIVGVIEKYEDGKNGAKKRVNADENSITDTTVCVDDGKFKDLLRTVYSLLFSRVGNLRFCRGPLVCSLRWCYGTLIETDVRKLFL